MDAQITILKAVKVLCIRTPCPDSAKIGAVSGKAFQDLESRLPIVDGKRILKGRKMYGAYQDQEYFACFTMQDGDNASEMNLEEWEIAGGKYVQSKINDWLKNTSQIGPTFDELAKKYVRDSSRPLIEFYRSEKELILFMPIK